jgi:hypothetical protein
VHQGTLTRALSVRHCRLDGQLCKQLIREFDIEGALRLNRAASYLRQKRDLLPDIGHR